MSDNVATNNFKEMVIEEEIFREARVLFNGMLQQLFKKMSKAESTEGSITLKIDFELEPMEVVDVDGNPSGGINPKMKHAVTTQVPVKDKLDGAVDPQMNLIYDPETGKYVLHSEAVNGQMNFETYAEAREKAEEQKMLETGKLGLPFNDDSEDVTAEDEYDPEDDDLSHWDSMDETA